MSIQYSNKYRAVGGCQRAFYFTLGLTIGMITLR